MAGQNPGQGMGDAPSPRRHADEADGCSSSRYTRQALAELGWRAAAVWECALRRPNHVTATCAALVSWLAADAPSIEIGEGDLAALDD